MSEEEEVPSTHASGEEEEEEEEEEEHEHEQEGEREGEEAGDAQSKIWLRGPSSLPRRPIPEHKRPLIKPTGTR